MKLFYLTEHTSCYNYFKFIEEGFRYYKFDTGLNHEEKLTKDCILFVVKGSLCISYRGHEMLVREGKMIFFCRDSLFNTYSLEPCEVVAAIFEGGIWPCQKASFSELYHLKDIVEYSMEPLEIRDRLHKFLGLLICYLEDGANCIHFHETKLRELFWNIRFYYSRQELALFFYTIIGRSQDFKNKVLNSCGKCRTVKDMASTCSMSLSAFKRQFMLEFGEAPIAWMQKQLLGEIKYKLSVTDLPLGTIANELEFSSLAYFSKYCKRCLGYSPTELRQRMKSGQKNARKEREE